MECGHRTPRTRSTLSIRLPHMLLPQLVKWKLATLTWQTPPTESRQVPQATQRGVLHHPPPLHKAHWPQPQPTTTWSVQSLWHQGRFIHKIMDWLHRWFHLPKLDHSTLTPQDVEMTPGEKWHRMHIFGRQFCFCCIWTYVTVVDTLCTQIITLVHCHCLTVKCSITFNDCLHVSRWR